MKKKALAIILLIITVWLIVTFVALACYHLIFRQDSDGPMETWAIIMLVLPFCAMVAYSVFAGKSSVVISDIFDDIEKKKMFEKITGNILGFLILLIFLLICLPFLLFFAFATRKTFKRLCKKGYKYYKKDRCYCWEKDNILISFSYSGEEYKISFDNGTSYVDIFDTELGALFEREELKGKVEAYRNASDLDRQRGDAVPPTEAFIDFLERHLE